MNHNKFDFVKIVKSSYWLFMAIALIEVWIFWPGIMRPDSLNQMCLAQSTSCLGGTDHHPPIMAFLWHYIAKIIPGPGGIFLIHEILFWSGVALLYRSLSNKIGRILLLMGCYLPQIFILRIFVLKDIGFTVCFMCVISVIIHAMISQRRLKVGEITLIIVLLFYGSAVKYQALFIAPIIIFWVVKNWLARGLCLSTIFYTSLWSGCLIITVNLFNNATSAPSHAWQYVKLFDLAGISVREHKILFPKFSINQPAFTYDCLQQLYSPMRVDDMVFPEHSILRKGTISQERDELMAYWQTTIMMYPNSYIKHRLSVFDMQIKSSPIKAPTAIKSQIDNSPAIFIKIGTILEKYHLIACAQMMTSLEPYLLISIIYILISWRQRSPTLQTLNFMNVTSLALLAVLFIFSMAAETRYAYLSTCLIHFSHAFAWQAFQSARYNNKTQMRIFKKF